MREFLRNMRLKWHSYRLERDLKSGKRQRGRTPEPAVKPVNKPVEGKTGQGGILAGRSQPKGSLTAVKIPRQETPKEG